MSQSTRFPIAVHILAALATKRTERLNSESLAWSTGTNASMVRRILAALSAAGLVKSQTGISGGANLAKPASDITLQDVYEAVKPKSNLGVHKANPKCPMGAVVADPLQSILDETEAAANLVLSGKTISEFSQDMVQRIKAKHRRKRK